MASSSSLPTHITMQSECTQLSGQQVLDVDQHHSCQTWAYRVSGNYLPLHQLATIINKQKSPRVMVSLPIYPLSCPTHSLIHFGIP